MLFSRLFIRTFKAFYKTMESEKRRNPVIIDIHNSIMDIHNSVMDIHN